MAYNLRVCSQEPAFPRPRGTKSRWNLVSAVAKGVERNWFGAAMNELQLRAKKQNLEWLKCNPIFDLSKRTPDLFRELCKKSPELKSAHSVLKTGFYLPQNAKLDVDSNFLRLPNHLRSFYYRLSPDENPARWFETDVLCFKGAEPLLPDFKNYLSWMSKTRIRGSQLPILDTFPMREGKVAGVVSLQEAQTEARIASELQLAHLKAYGTLAAIPTPLFVYSFAGQDSEKLFKSLKGLMQTRAFQRIEPLRAQGFAVLVYYFPHLPVRADYFGATERALLRAKLKTLPNVEETLDGWLRICARMMLMGFLPGTSLSIGLGSCLDFGNATIFGGLCDLDSVFPINSAYNDGFIYEAIAGNMSILQISASRLLNVPQDANNATQWAVQAHLMERLRYFLKADKRAGKSVPPQVSNFFDPKKRLIEKVFLFQNQFAHVTTDSY